MAVDASGIDPQQDRHAVTRSPGHLGRGDSRVEAERDAAVAQIVGTACQRRGSLRFSERGGAGSLPNTAVAALAEDGAVATVKEPTVWRGAELVEVRAEQGNKAATLRSAAPALPAPRSGSRPRSRGRAILIAVGRSISNSSSPLYHCPASAGTRRERFASPAAMACGHPRLNPAESRRS